VHTSLKPLACRTPTTTLPRRSLSTRCVKLTSTHTPRASCRLFYSTPPSPTGKPMVTQPKKMGGGGAFFQHVLFPLSLLPVRVPARAYLTPETDRRMSSCCAPVRRERRQSSPPASRRTRARPPPFIYFNKTISSISPARGALVEDRLPCGRGHALALLSRVPRTLTAGKLRTA
jgi:hypothetical protein